MYGTTKFFLEHFGLRDLSQLPPLREVKELGESEQAMLPMDEEGNDRQGMNQANEETLQADIEQADATEMAEANDPGHSCLAHPFERS